MVEGERKAVFEQAAKYESSLFQNKGTKYFLHVNVDIKKYE